MGAEPRRLSEVRGLGHEQHTESARSETVGCRVLAVERVRAQIREVAELSRFSGAQDDLDEVDAHGTLEPETANRAPLSLQRAPIEVLARRVACSSSEPARLDLHRDERFSVRRDEIELGERSAHSATEHAPPEFAQVARGESFAAQAEFRSRGARELQEELGREAREQRSN